MECKEIKNNEYCNICGFRVDSLGIERHADWCPNFDNPKTIKIRSIKRVTINEVISAKICLIDNDRGVVIFYD